MAQQLPPQQMNVGLGGPQWANPNGVPVQQTQANINSTIGGAAANQHESDFFAPVSTLDEPIRETLMRDVRSVGSKLKVVLLPMERSVCFILLTTESSVMHQRVPERVWTNILAAIISCDLICHQLMYFSLLLWCDVNLIFHFYNHESVSASVWWVFGSFSVGNHRPDRARQTNH